MRGPSPFRRADLRAIAWMAALACGVPGAARAQEDAGVSDAGPDPCDPRCEGDLLLFCDADAPVTLDCRAQNGRCAILSAEWGADCVLSAGEACDPGYAFDLSRCDRAASLYCVDGTCTVADGPPPAEPDEEPTRGTEIALETAASNPFGCADCGTGQAAALVPALVLLRALRRVRRRAHAGR